MRRLDENTVVLCRRGKSCCPVVTRTDDGYTITDDFGGKVQLTEDESQMLVEHMKNEERELNSHNE